MKKEELRESARVFTKYITNHPTHALFLIALGQSRFPPAVDVLGEALKQLVRREGRITPKDVPQENAYLLEALLQILDESNPKATPEVESLRKAAIDMLRSMLLEPHDSEERLGLFHYGKIKEN